MAKLTESDPDVEIVKVQIAPLVESAKRLTGDSKISIQDAINAGWTADPGVGKAILLPDGREVCNPLTAEPTVTIDRAPTMFELMELQDRERRLRDNVLDETEEEADDFDVPEDLIPATVYEVEMLEEYPEFNFRPPPEERGSKEESPVAAPSAPPPAKENS